MSYMSNTAGVLSEAGTAYPSRALDEFTPGFLFLVGSVLLIFLVLCVVLI